MSRGRKSAATRMGITPEEYEARRAVDRWCPDCRQWHTRTMPIDWSHLLARVLVR